MPTNIRIIHAHDFIKATPEGELDFATTKKLLMEIVSASAPLGEYDIVLDTRKAQSVLSVTDLWYLAAELGKLREPFSRPVKTAVLCPLIRFDLAEFFALCAKNRGFNVKAFSSLEDSIEWMIANGTDA
jgi:hypothetical protein